MELWRRSCLLRGWGRDQGARCRVHGRKRLGRCGGLELWRSANFLSFFMSTAAKRSGDISVLVMVLSYVVLDNYISDASPICAIVSMSR